MDDQYVMPDLRQFIAGGSFFPPTPEYLATHRSNFTPMSQPPPPPYGLLLPDTLSAAQGANTSLAARPAAGSTGGGVELINFRMDSSGGGDGGTARWPRQETLTLLEIRSRLDRKFKEANQKGPLWEEVSRIMLEEHGYHRRGKKCREKFENLYKYYKKTKEGKAGRQDGKHYRFFRQLEALYGQASGNSGAAVAASENHFAGGNYNQYMNCNQDCYMDPKLSDTSIISLSNSLNSDMNSSDYNDSGDTKLKKRKGKGSLKAKIREHIDAQMREVMERQEAWMEQMSRSIEAKERERSEREEEWRRQDAARIEREHGMWAKERNWIKMRDAALMEAIHRLTGNQLRPNTCILTDQIRIDGTDSWQECDHEIARLGGVEASGREIGGHPININGNSPANDEGLFRYFLGDGHGRLM